MSRTLKAGVPHVIKVNTKADKMGFESGFRMKYFDDATRSMVDVPGTFFEFENTVTPASTTTTAGAALGDKILTVANTAGFEAGCSINVNGKYYRVVDVNNTDSKLTLKNGIEAACVSGSAVTLSGRTGTYGLSVTFPAAGNYTVHITNYAIGMDNEPVAITVENATVDDVKVLLDAVQSDVAAVKTQVDALDEIELNNISEKVDSLQANLAAVHQILKDTSDVYVEVAGDYTAAITTGSTLSFDNGVTAKVQVVKLVDGNTAITLQDASGAVSTANTITIDGTPHAILGLENNVINSVYEFVENLQTMLQNPSIGLTEIINLGKDIETMINGGALLTDGSANPTAGKGIVAVFDKAQETLARLNVVAADNTTEHAAITAAITAAKDGILADSAAKVTALGTTISDAKTSIESNIAAAQIAITNLITTKSAEIKTIVDANKALLEDSSYGLAALLAALTTASGNVTSSVSDMITTAKTELTTQITGLATAVASAKTDVTNAIAANHTVVLGKFDEIGGKLDSMSVATKYSVFA